MFAESSRNLPDTTSALVERLTDELERITKGVDPEPGTLINIYVSAQLGIAKQRADAMITLQAIDLQAKLAKFANERIHELNAAVNSSRDSFLREMAPQLDLLDQFQHRPELYESMHTLLNHQILAYFDTTRAQLEGFLQALRDQVGNPSSWSVGL